jgi:hypothetical protein
VVRRRKIEYVCLTVMSDNKHARRIYEKWGSGEFSAAMWKTGLRDHPHNRPTIPALAGLT